MEFLLLCYFQELEQLLEDCTRFAGKEVPYAVETLARLQREELPAVAASDDGLAEVPQVDDAAAEVDEELVGVVPQAVNDAVVASDGAPALLFLQVDDAAAARNDEVSALVPHAVDEEQASFIPQVDDVAAWSNEATASFLSQVDDAAIDEERAAVVPQFDDAAAGSNDCLQLAIDDASDSPQVLDLETFDDASGSQVLDLEILSPTTSY